MHAGLDGALDRGRRDQVLGLADRPLDDSLGRDGSARVGADVDRDDRRADIGGLPFGHEQVSDHALIRTRQLDDRLGGLDLHDDLVHGDLVTWLDVPPDDVGLGQAFSDVRELELLEI